MAVGSSASPRCAVVSLLPWRRLKRWLKRTIEHLPPWAALGVFVVPFVVLLPLKFLEVYFIATRNWLGAGAVLVLAKLLASASPLSCSTPRATSYCRWPGSTGSTTG